MSDPKKKPKSDPEELSEEEYARLLEQELDVFEIDEEANLRPTPPGPSL